jgi:Right handed beta helix region
MVPLILLFFSLADDAQAGTVNIPCGRDIDATINADPRTTPSTFVLGAGCTFTASASIVPSNGDVVKCERPPDFRPLEPLGEELDPTKTPYDPTTHCTVAGAANVTKVFWPIGQGGGKATVRFEGIKITGGNFTGSSATGTGIAEGVMSDSSYHYGIEVRDNDAAGITNAKGTFERVELTNNTLDPDALGFIGAGLKALTEVEVKNSYIHDTKGNGLWCDVGCVAVDPKIRPNGFWVHDNLVVNTGRGGIRFENVGGSNAGEALIENNQVHGNSPDVARGGISVRDAQNAIIRNNHFGGVTIAGATIAGVAYPPVAYPPNSLKVAVMASDSGRTDRPNLSNIDIVDNDLSGEKATEIIKGCELPDTVVYCAGNTPP